MNKLAAAERPSQASLWGVFYRRSSVWSHLVMQQFHGTSSFVSVLTIASCLKARHFSLMEIIACLTGGLKLSWVHIIQSLDQAITFRLFDWKSFNVYVIPVFFQLLNCDRLLWQWIYGKKGIKHLRASAIAWIPCHLNYFTNTGILRSQWWD